MTYSGYRLPGKLACLLCLLVFGLPQAASAAVAGTPPSPPQEELPANSPRLSPEFHANRMRTLHMVTGFARLGLIGPPASAPDTERHSFSLRRDAAHKMGSRQGGFELFVFEDMALPDAAGCREAVDALFFDEIDALVLDGSGCFDPARHDFRELMDLLRQRRILPLSLEDPALAAAGALVAPWEGEQASATKVGTAAPSLGEATRHPLADTGQTQYILNLGTAAAMGFDPPVALLALTRRYID